MLVDKNLLDKIASDYHLSKSEPDMFIENMCQKYELEWVVNQIKSGSRVLDLGFGDGLFLEEIAKSNELTIVEGSRSLAEVAESKILELGLNARVIHSLFEEFSTESNFDVVIASHVLEHVDNPSVLLEKIKSWLDKEGKLICIVPNRESLHRRLGLRMGLIKKLDELSARDKLVGHQRVYSFGKLSDEINESGFEIKIARGFFTKTLANSQMLDLHSEVILGLCMLSEELPIEMGANLGLVATLKNAKNE